ncbi:MAG: Hsp70 family protein [Candidatus Bipolaricaulota bacterium]|nr:Hsp70 family protein [Candidatus Bipolaricaulota bacterium]
MSRPEEIVAIDLGTTNSEAAVVGSDGRVKLLKNRAGRKKTPTAIWFDKDGKVFGQQAKRMEKVEPDKVLFQFKPELDQDGNQFNVDSRKLGPVKLAQLFYQEIKDQAQERLGEEVNRAVLTIPAWFHQIGRETLKKGAEKAGFKVERILREPASASLAYALDTPLNREEKILVYDLGGGTFDTSVLVANEKDGRPDLKILGNRGDTSLGGRDFDRKILEEFFVEKFRQKHGTDPTDQKRVEAEWLERAKDLKEELSEADRSKDMLQADGEVVSVELTRREFADLINEEITRTVDILEELLNEVGIEKDELDRLVMVGGSSRIVPIREKVSKLVGLEQETGIDPDLAVVSGAALVAGTKADRTIRDENGVRVPLLAGEIKEVVSRGLGVKAYDPQTGEYYNEVLIEPGEPLRATGTEMFNPKEDDSDLVKITIVEGSSNNLEECRILKEGYKLSISNPRASNLVEIEVGLAINKDGLVEVIAETDDGDELREEFENPDLIDDGE